MIEETQATREETTTVPSSEIPSHFLVTIQGKPFILYTGLLHLAHQRGLVSLSAVWTYNDAGVSLAQAIAVFADGRRFEESGDATPENVGAKVKPHWRRMALVRSKARCLRDALDIAYTCAEELA